MQKLNLSIEEIIKSINPEIKPNLWINKNFTNCYAYALGLDIKQRSICPYAYQPGTLSGKSPLLHELKDFTNETIVNYVESDFKKLKLDFCQINPFEKIATDEWKIILYTAGNELLIDFHFIRGNSNDMWSHKNGFLKTPEKISNKKIEKYIYEGLEDYNYQKCYVLKKAN